jgi:hypothetical protein
MTPAFHNSTEFSNTGPATTWQHEWFLDRGQSGDRKPWAQQKQAARGGGWR